ncbi:uncharacterized protein L203_104109 [Cryptococcus depauperatus CBS 7841]|uniref:Uncharacterized protein n=1 Tax=Cryptococcus depauperatus CBS 7841 TaxID=1295531 RepID=A0AAJ8JV56_9TREE
MDKERFCGDHSAIPLPRHTLCPKLSSPFPLYHPDTILSKREERLMLGNSPISWNQMISRKKEEAQVKELWK